MAKRLTHGKKVKAPAQSDGFFVRVGSGSSLTEWKRYQTEGQARNAMVAHFEAQKAWCQRSNSKMLPNLSDAITEIAGLGILSTPKRVEAMMDDYSTPPMILVAEVRTA